MQAGKASGLTGLALLGLAVAATAAGPVERKLIEFGWDEPDTAFMRKHVDQLENWRKEGWSVDEPGKNVHTPEAFEALTRKALQTADEYVWIYTETPRWWSDGGKPVKLPPAYDAALRKARQPVTTTSRPG